RAGHPRPVDPTHLTIIYATVIVRSFRFFNQFQRNRDPCPRDHDDTRNRGCDPVANLPHPRRSRLETNLVERSANFESVSRHTPVPLRSLREPEHLLDVAEIDPPQIPLRPLDRTPNEPSRRRRRQFRQRARIEQHRSAFDRKPPRLETLGLLPPVLLV